MTARLVTIGPSHYCEKARWALDRAGIGYRESVYLPMLHWGASLPLGSRTVPVLVHGATKLTESSAIVAFADERLAAEKKLYPSDPSARAEVLALEKKLDDELGPLTRRLAYCMLVPRPALFAKVFDASAPPLQQRLFRRGHGLLRGALGRAFKVSPKAEARLLTKLHALFEEIALTLGDKPFLVGDSFSAADLTFAALATPVLLPDEFRLGGVTHHDLPDDMRATIDAARETRAGRHALAMYASHRH